MGVGSEGSGDNQDIGFCNNGFYNSGQLSPLAAKELSDGTILGSLRKKLIVYCLQYSTRLL